MRVSQRSSLCIGAAVLAALWYGPAATWSRHSFAAHMTVHMGVVAVAAPLLAVGLAGGRFDPSLTRPVLFNPIVASAAELIVVWAWHAPILHGAARANTGLWWLEQASFLIAGLWLWLAACGGSAVAGGARAWNGVAGLLFTSIHMTLLGAIFALAPRDLYGGHGAAALYEQHLGGGIMLVAGGASYLSGALWLAMSALRQPAVQRGERR
jgi:putative membrane protein